jgi:hypothetical protein
MEEHKIEIVYTSEFKRNKTEQSDISSKCIKEIIEAFETDFFN